MYIKNRVRRVVAAAAVTTSVALAVAAAGAVRADSSVTPDAGSIDVSPGAGSADSPPGSRLDREDRPANNDVTVVDRYEVVDGDSFWAIAERRLPDGATARDVWALTEVLMAYNGPRLGYGDPAMLTPGDIVDIVSAPSMPASLAAAQPAPDEAGVAPVTHQVVAGDSYWVIAESILGDEATPGEVLDKTEDLIALNGPRLGYEDPQMLHPGDVVYLHDAASTTNASLDEGVDTEVAGTNNSTPATITTPAASAQPTTTDWTTPWTSPLATVNEVAHGQTPTSPPLSEVALIHSETTRPLTSATSRTDPVDKRTGAGRDDPRRGGALPSAPLTPAATPVNVSAS